MTSQSGFSQFVHGTGELANRAFDEFSSSLWAWSHEPLELSSSATHFGFVLEGTSILNTSSGTFTLRRGMYFSAPGTATVSGGRGVIMTRHHYHGLFSLGGPIESTGRLQYVDGCYDTLLISPPLLGDPCLNLLHLPPRTEQTAHTHPSLRLGAIIDGHGECILHDQKIDLHPGLIFLIEPHALHNFRTADSDLLVVAYHPDSDFGPSHENHPMVNRTVITPLQGVK